MLQEDGELSPKRRKLHFNPLKSDDRYNFPAKSISRNGCSSRVVRSQSRSTNRYNSSNIDLNPKYQLNSRPHLTDESEQYTNEEESKALDREWYAGDESGYTFGDDSHNPFGSYDNSWVDQQHEAALAEKKLGKRISTRAAQKLKDVDAWETNRMLTSGVAQRRDFGDEFEDDEEATRVHLLVHDLRPPFLDGRTVFSKQLEPVPAMRDYQSDMAVFSRKGSKVVKERRQQKERQKQAQEATSMAGTMLGNLMGVKGDEEEEKTKCLETNSLGGKEQGNSKFAQHLKKCEGASNFSQSKSLRAKRIFACLCCS